MEENVKEESNLPGQPVEQKKKIYQKPLLCKVHLEAGEAVLATCKTGALQDCQYTDLGCTFTMTS